MALIEPPAAYFRNPHEVQFVEDDPQRPDSSLQDRRIRDVKCESALSQKSSSLVGFGYTLFGKIDVGPPGKSVLPVPGTFPMPQQHDFVHVLLPERLSFIIDAGASIRYDACGRGAPHYRETSGRSQPANRQTENRAMSSRTRDRPDPAWPCLQWETEEAERSKKMTTCRSDDP